MEEATLAGISLARLGLRARACVRDFVVALQSFRTCPSAPEEQGPRSPIGVLQARI